MQNFYLKKWYMDAADKKGNVYIGYHAQLKWKFLNLHYYSHLFRSANGKATTNSGFIRKNQPAIRGKMLSWNTKGFSGKWASQAKPVEEIILSNGKGSILWKCLQPKAGVEIESDELSFRGLGYTECIEITLPVWEVPVKALHWGRFLSKKNYLIWINLEGIGKSIAYCNGKRCSNFSVTSRQVKGKDFALTMGKRSVLRKGKIGATVFQKLSLLKMLPRKPLMMDENKWVAQGKLFNEEGTAIFEKVLW
jgi:hypothetical protein